MSTAKKEKTDRTLAYMAGGVCVLMVIVAVIILLFMHSTRVRVVEQNRQYLEDAARESVRSVDDIFDNASKSAVMVARVYELQLAAPEFDYRLLNDMSEPTCFDYIRFVGMDGTSWAGDGTTNDCSDRKYYTEGIRGLSGVDYVERSRFTDNAVLVFYTPLYYQGEIIGVVNGVMDAGRLTERLTSTFFGQSSNACLCLPDGTVVAASVDETGASAEAFFAGLIIEEDLAGPISAGKTMSFGYDCSVGEGNGYLGPVAGGAYMLLQTLPASVTQAITRRANHDALQLELTLLAVFLIFLGAVAIYSVNNKRQLVREKSDLSQIVDSVKRLYRRFMVLDLAADSYEYLEKDDVTAIGLPEKGSYSQWLAAVQAQHDADPRTWGDVNAMTVENLRQTLTPENWYAYYEYPTPDGRWERLSLIRLDSGLGETNRVLGAVEDITDARTRDEQNRIALEEAFRAAEAASHAKSDFLSRMSHDIRTPMNAIIGLTAIMGSHLDDRDRVVDCLAKITSSSKHLLGIINEVLDMSKIESGKLVLSEDEFSLSTLMDDLIDIVMPTIKAKHQELSVSISDIIHEDVIGDALRLQQVCVNILSNAVKYTPDGGKITIGLAERPGKQPRLGEYEFTFEDNGIGMTPEFLERLFAPFERADDERVSVTQGTGLGMPIAQSIVHLMGGTISVESEPGKGTRFTVRISLKVRNINKEAEERLNGLPVLVADDEQVACEMACQMLNELGMRGEWVLTGREAVERVVDHRDRGEDFFAVILDWKMPGMDGVETARAIRKEVGPDVPIIILSAYDWSEIESEARAAGVNAFIGKPLFKSRLRGVFVDLVSDEEPETADPLSAVKERDFTGRRVLLVEDNALNQEIAQEILEMTGLTVEVAENGQVAVDKVQAAPAGYYDIVFMDIQMPIMNGYEATRAIRALPVDPGAARLPIVAMTANTFSEDVQAAMDAGMDQHIGKPLDMGQLMGVLEKWLG